MTKSSDPSIPFPGADDARTRRQLRLIKALFRIDDPELEQALTLIVERLASACEQERAAAVQVKVTEVRVEPKE